MIYHEFQMEKDGKFWLFCCKGKFVPVHTMKEHGGAQIQLHSFFFFFHWYYSPLWALACRTMSFHFFLSATLSIFSLPALKDLCLVPLSIFSWVFPFFSSLPVLE